MSELLIIEINPASAEQYNEVNDLLGLNTSTGEGDWPDGLRSHTGATTSSGGVSVVEIWDSQEAQAAFMQSRLGPALGKAGLPEPTRVEWMSLLAHHDH